MFLDLAVLFLKLICLGSEIIDIIIQTVILLFSLDECVDSLLNTRNASGLTDLLKGILHCCDILNILIHKLFLALVGLNYFRQAQFEDQNVVAEISNRLLFVSLLLVLGCVILNGGGRLLLSQMFTHLLYFILEGLLVFLVFGSQRNALIRVLLS